MTSGKATTSGKGTGLSRREIDTYPLARPGLGQTHSDNRAAARSTPEGGQEAGAGPGADAGPEIDHLSGFYLDRSHLDAAYQADAYPDPDGRLRESYREAETRQIARGTSAHRDTAHQGTARREAAGGEAVGAGVGGAGLGVGGRPGGVVRRELLGLDAAGLTTPLVTRARADQAPAGAAPRPGVDLSGLRTPPGRRAAGPGGSETSARRAPGTRPALPERGRVMPAVGRPARSGMAATGLPEKDADLPGAPEPPRTAPPQTNSPETGPLETGPLTAPVLAPLGHSPALDGLRALAVLSVMAYHAGLSWMPGGLLGVDAFFVLSGFLITGLLVTEYRTTRRIDLKSFWIRRTRRLMPALLTMMLGVAAYARWVAAPSEVRTLRLDALATLGYVANWRFALSDQSYFDHFSAPSPLLHTWSLAVEEQFYVLWPLCVYLLMWHSGRTAARWRQQRRKAQTLILTVAVLGAEASALLGLLLVVLDVDPSRIYYGTDSRAQALLAGAALAVWRIQRRTPLTDRTKKGLAVVGCLAGIAMLTVWATVDGESRVLYSGGFLGVAVVVMLLVASIVEVPGGPAARVLSFPPLPAIGRVSYGLYLWHWPVFLTVTAGRTGLSGVALLGARVAVTAAITIISFHLVENPIRRRKIRFPVPRVTVPATIGAIVAVVMVATIPDPSAGRGADDLERLAARAATATPPTARAEAAAAGRPLRAIMAGDSLALTLGFSQFSVTAADHGLEIHDAAELGCGVTRAQVRFLGDGRNLPPVTCADWPGRFRQKLAEIKPDLALLLVGRWEVTDQILNGRRVHIGEPAFDAYLGRELDLAITTLSANGAKVVLLTAPMFEEGEAADGSIYPETRADRVVRFNALLRQAAARHPAATTVIDLAAILSPGNQYRGTIDGVQVRDDDGVHISNGGGARAGDVIVPQLLRLLRPDGSGAGAAAAAAPSPAPE